MASDNPDNVDGLSQADIDAALAAAGGGAASSPGSDELGSTSDSMPVFSQSEIDAALAAAQDEDKAGASSSQAPAAIGTNPDGSVKLDSSGRPFDEAAAMMEAAIAEERAAAQLNAASPGGGSVAASAGGLTLDLPDLGGGLSDADEKGISLIGDVRLDVKIELGRADMYIEDVLKLGEGAVVELDKLAGDPVDVLVNDRLVARGEVLVLNDNFCVRISEILPGAGEAVEAAT